MDSDLQWNIASLPVISEKKIVSRITYYKTKECRVAKKEESL